MQKKLVFVEDFDIEKLNPYEGNAKIHTDAQIEEIMESIRRYGFNDPVAVWGPDNTIVEGHGRVIALQRLGYKTVPCIVRLDHLTDEERREYTLVHNSITLDTGMDMQKVQEELSRLINSDMSAFGLLVAVDEGAAVVEDDYTPGEDIPDRVKLGEVWQLGRHTLVCGDSTKEEIVNKATGGGGGALL
ncbi:MAG: ParB N-terminal domain-containing protein, partial [Clostridia bacterium]|nr:ParB N-terminal domain-containing protein [Clostridia bacterium]